MARPSTHVPFSRYLFFLGEAIRDFTTTGAVAPSSKALARALTARARSLRPSGLRILEIGAGTGPATELLLPLVTQGTELDVVEPNPRFVAALSDLVSDHRGASGHSGGRVTIHATTLQDFQADAPYDVIVSGLPLKNFSPDTVHALLTKSLDHLTTNGTFTAFSYLGAVRLRALTGTRDSLLEHLRVEEVVDDFRRRHGDGHVAIWGNLPPAEAWTLRAPVQVPTHHAPNGEQSARSTP